MFFSENKAIEQDCCPPKRVSSISHHYPIPGLRSKHVFIFRRLKHSKESLSGSLGSKAIWFSLDFVSWFLWSGDTIAKDVHQYNGSSCCLFQYYIITFSAEPLCSKSHNNACLMHCLKSKLKEMRSAKAAASFASNGIWLIRPSVERNVGTVFGPGNDGVMDLATHQNWRCMPDKSLQQINTWFRKCCRLPNLRQVCWGRQKHKRKLETR